MKEFFKQYPGVSTLALILLLVVLWQAQYVIGILFMSFVLTVVLLPFVRVLKKAHIPAPFAVLAPVLTFVGGGVALFYKYRTVASEEFAKFLSSITDIVNKLPFGSDVDLSEAALLDFTSDFTSKYSSEIFGVSVVIVQAIFAALTVLVLTTYWLGSYRKIRARLISSFGKQRSRIEDIYSRIEAKLGRWFIGQITVSTIVGIMVYIAALALDLPYAALLAVLAFLFEVVPTVGPIAAAVPAILLASTDSMEKALITTAVYIIIQQIESHLISPNILGRAVKLHPMAVILGFLTGASLFGFVGALFAIPAVVIVLAVADSYLKNPHPKDHEAPIARILKRKAKNL